MPAAEAVNEVRIAVIDVLGKSHKDTGTPMASVALDVEPYGVEVPILKGAVGQHQVAAKGTAFVEAVVQ